MDRHGWAVWIMSYVAQKLHHEDDINDRCTLTGMLMTVSNSLPVSLHTGNHAVDCKLRGIQSVNMSKRSRKEGNPKTLKY